MARRRRGWRRIACIRAGARHSRYRDALAWAGAFGASIGIERPFDVILDKAVAKHGAGMIEHDGVGLAVGGPQHAADHLPVQAHLVGRPGQDAAADLGHVPAFGQHHAVA